MRSLIILHASEEIPAHDIWTPIDFINWSPLDRRTGILIHIYNNFIRTIWLCFFFKWADDIQLSLISSLCGHKIAHGIDFIAIISIDIIIGSLSIHSYQLINSTIIIFNSHGDRTLLVNIVTFLIRLLGINDSCVYTLPKHSSNIVLIF